MIINIQDYLKRSPQDIFKSGFEFCMESYYCQQKPINEIKDWIDYIKKTQYFGYFDEGMLQAIEIIEKYKRKK
jgi:cob(I)alamin adenosyltransferase